MKKSFKNQIQIFSLALLSMGIWSCGGGNPTPTTPLYLISNVSTTTDLPNSPSYPTQTSTTNYFYDTQNFIVKDSSRYTSVYLAKASYNKTVYTNVPTQVSGFSSSWVTGGGSTGGGPIPTITLNSNGLNDKYLYDSDDYIISNADGSKPRVYAAVTGVPGKKNLVSFDGATYLYNTNINSLNAENYGKAYNGAGNSYNQCTKITYSDGAYTDFLNYQTDTQNRIIGYQEKVYNSANTLLMTRNYTITYW